MVVKKKTISGYDFLRCCRIMHSLSFKCFVINHSGLFYYAFKRSPCIILQKSLKIEIYFLINRICIHQLHTILSVKNDARMGWSVTGSKDLP